MTNASQTDTDGPTPRHPRMDFERALVLDTVRVTEQAAIAAARVAGMGDADLVDQAAPTPCDGCSTSSTSTARS
jgi:hypothetical protein